MKTKSRKRRALVLALLATVAAAIAGIAAYAYLATHTDPSTSTTPSTLTSPANCASSNAAPAAGACAITIPTLSPSSFTLGNTLVANSKINSNTTTGGARTYSLAQMKVVLSSPDAGCTTALGSAAANTVQAGTLTSTNGWWTLSTPVAADVGGDSGNTITGTGFSTSISVPSGSSGAIAGGAGSGQVSVNFNVTLNSVATDQSACAGKLINATVSL